MCEPWWGWLCRTREKLSSRPVRLSNLSPELLAFLKVCDLAHVRGELRPVGLDQRGDSAVVDWAAHVCAGGFIRASEAGSISANRLSMADASAFVAGGMGFRYVTRFRKSCSRRSALCFSSLRPRSTATRAIAVALCPAPSPGRVPLNSSTAMTILNMPSYARVKLGGRPGVHAGVNEHVLRDLHELVDGILAALGFFQLANLQQVVVFSWAGHVEPPSSQSSGRNEST